MPELPEVTVISEDVAALAVGREVLRAAVFRPDVTNVEPERVREAARREDAACDRTQGQDHRPRLRGSRRARASGHLRKGIASARMEGAGQDKHRGSRVRRRTPGAGFHAALARVLRPLRAGRRRETPPDLTPRPRPFLRGLHSRVPCLRFQSQGEREGPASRPIRSGRPRQHLRGRGPLLGPRPSHAKSQHPLPETKYRTSTPQPATSCVAPSSCAAPPSTPTTTPSGRPASSSTSS